LPRKLSDTAVVYSGALGTRKLERLRITWIADTVIAIGIYEFPCMSEALLVVYGSIVIETQNEPDPIIFKFKAVQANHTFVVFLTHGPAEVQNPGLKIVQLLGVFRLWPLAQGVRHKSPTNRQMLLRNIT
jgi:hypothetical protein